MTYKSSAKMEKHWNKSLVLRIDIHLHNNVTINSGRFCQNDVFIGTYLSFAYKQSITMPYVELRHDIHSNISSLDRIERSHRKYQNDTKCASEFSVIQINKLTCPMSSHL